MWRGTWIDPERHGEFRVKYYTFVSLQLDAEINNAEVFPAVEHEKMVQYTLLHENFAVEAKIRVLLHLNFAVLEILKEKYGRKIYKY